MVRLARAERRAHDDGSCELRWVQALSISVRSSRGVRSDIERRCRGDCLVEVDLNRRLWEMGRRSGRTEGGMVMGMVTEAPESSSATLRARAVYLQVHEKKNVCALLQCRNAGQWSLA